MPEDEFDFAGQNPARQLKVDKSRKIKTSDYEVQLRQKGYTQESPPDLAGLFKALATRYIPPRVVQLPPKVVTRVHIIDLNPFASGNWLGGLFIILFIILFYLVVIGYFGIFIPYLSLASYEVRLHLRPGAICTVSRIDIRTSMSEEIPTFSPEVDFTLRTPQGKSYDTSDFWSIQNSGEARAEAYIARFRTNQSYKCWYDPNDPTQATLSEEATRVGFWDYVWSYFGLVFSLTLCIFLLIVPFLQFFRFIRAVRQGRIEIVK